MNQILEKTNQLKGDQRYSCFAIVLNVPVGESLDWTMLSDLEAHDKLLDLKFISPRGLEKFFLKSKFVYTSSLDGRRIRYFSIPEFVGQLERGVKNKRPHYNLLVRTSCKVRSRDLVRELSKALYGGVRRHDSISVDVSHNEDALKDYCLKEESRLVLEGTDYYPPLVDSRQSEFQEFLIQVPSALKYWSIHFHFNNK
jgi:hypothetical protein